ncbi:MAG: homoserine kinase [Candidatus Cloacimonetes bacterium]|nr:homoserine kinase [Candidatus Cloacimonadota bacterium]
MRRERIKSATANYNIGTLVSFIKMKHGFGNLNYRVQTTKGTYLLRYNIQKDISLIEYEVSILLELKQINFPTAYPIKMKNGEYILDDLIVLYEFIDGYIPKLNVNTVKEIAKAAASLNSFTRWSEFERKNIMNLNDCIDLIRKFSNAKYKYPLLFRDFIKQIEFIKNKLFASLPRGLIHADLFPDNVVFRNDKLVAILDFEDMCTDNLIFEVGMAINGFCFINNELDQYLMNTFLKNYSKVRPLTKKEIELLPVYIHWTALGMVSWHLKRLIGHKNDRQLTRARELMDRVKVIRKIKNWELF